VKFLRSLRARLLLGSVLWTMGLLPLSHVVSVGLAVHYPGIAGLPRVIFVSPAEKRAEAFRMMVMHYGVALGFAVVLMVAGLLLIRSGLSPMNRLRERLAAVHAGREPRIVGVYPTEVQPLVNDLNMLLDQREETVSRAIAKAGDLAHGLKTPLSILTRESELVRDAGQAELAGAIAEQVERMRRQMDYHLAHARAAASSRGPGSQCAVAPSASGLIRTMERLHADRGLVIELHVDPEHLVRASREDVDEMVGNLVDNACKWASSRVIVSSERRSPDILIVVEDDGPGLAPSMREAVLQRGVKADEAMAGTGFGLAIVRDLAELYGGSIALDESSLKGLRARLTLPAC
jgi:signal transduction histidine kinase